MSEPALVIYTTLEQILSSDHLRTGRLAGKAAQDALLGLTKGVDFSGTFDSPVREGLNAAPGAGLSVDVSPGEMMRFEVGILPTADESRFRLAKLTATQNLPLVAADPVNPRIDVISALEAVNNTDNQARNVLQLPSRVVTPVNVNKLREPSITLTATPGVAGPTPAFPAPPAGEVALWYVYVPAAAAVILNAHLMDARVYWKTNTFNLFGSGLRTTVQAAQDDVTPSLARMQIGTGQVVVSRGGVAQINTVETYLLNDIVQSGEVVPIADRTEVDHYLVVKGNGVPVGKAEANGVIPVATGLAAVAPPNANGTPPGGGITYYPLLSLGLTNVTFTTTRAAFIGSIASAGGGSYAPEAGGLPLDKGGIDYAAAIGHNGALYQIGGVTRYPRLTNIASTNAAQIGAGSVIVNQSPIFFNGATATMPTLGNPGDKGDGGGGAGANDLVVGENTLASTFYYVYLRPRISTTVLRSRPRELTEVISSEAPTNLGGKPTPEAGFVGFEYLFIGSFRTDAAGNVIPFHRQGEAVYWYGMGVFAGFASIHNADIAISPALTAIQMLMPATSRLGIVRGEALLQAASGTVDTTTYRLFSPDNLAAFTFNQWDMRITADAQPHPGIKVTRQTIGDFVFPTNVGGGASGQIGANRLAILGGSAFNLHLWQAGYIEPIGATTP